MKKTVITVLCSIVALSSIGQNKEARQQRKEERREKINQLIKQEEEGALIFHKQSVFGLKLKTDGYGLFYELGKLKTPTKTNYWTIELAERKHPKEEKLTRNNNFGQAIGNPYIYGKINNFYYAKLGVGQQRLIGGKGNKNGVAVSAIYGGGFAAGLLKPYYIELNDPTGRKTVKYNGSNDSAFLSAENIYGAASFGKGFNEIKFVPGVYGKAALRFDYGRFNESVNAIEVGINFDFYTQKTPILISQPGLYRNSKDDPNRARQFFFNAYAAIVFGRRK